ncbi:MAG TPA: DUF1622 domain-containing protein [Nitrososphaeraceae archaeon]|nr:DUF1622 domain-containing protein [Nitrososphaeraceae archaeon]
MGSPEIFHIIVEYIVVIIEIIVAILVSALVIITLAKLVKLLLSKIRKEQRQVYVHKIVARMLRGLLIALDFLIAADLLQTILEPTLEETAVFALIVVLRILLSWSLSKEIEMGAKEELHTHKQDI